MAHSCVMEMAQFQILVKKYEFRGWRCPGLQSPLKSDHNVLFSQFPHLDTCPGTLVV